MSQKADDEYADRLVARTWQGLHSTLVREEEAKDAGNLCRGDAPFEENSGRGEHAPEHQTEPYRPS